MADQVIDLRRQQCADRAAGHHDAENAGAVALGEHLGDERDADDDLGAGADPGEKAENAELQRGLRQTLQRGEHAEDQDAERQRADPADIVGDDAEGEAAEGPAQQPRGADQAADPPDIGRGRVRHQLLQRRLQNQRIEAEIGRIQRPAGPHDEEHQPLIACNAPRKAQAGIDRGTRLHVPFSQIRSAAVRPRH